MNLCFVLALQSKLNQTEEQCYSFEQKLKGECCVCWFLLTVPAGQQCLKNCEHSFESIVGNERVYYLF